MSSPPSSPPTLYADAYWTIFTFLEAPTLASVASGCKLFHSLLVRLMPLLPPRAVGVRLKAHELADAMSHDPSQQFELPPFPPMTSPLRYLVTRLDTANLYWMISSACQQDIAGCLPSLKSLSFNFSRTDASDWIASAEDEKEGEEEGQEVRVFIPSPSLKELSTWWWSSGSALIEEIPAILRIASGMPSLTSLRLEAGQVFELEHGAEVPLPSFLADGLRKLPLLRELRMVFENASSDMMGTEWMSEEDAICIIRELPHLTSLNLQEGFLSAHLFKLMLADDESTLAFRSRITHLNVIRNYMTAEANEYLDDLLPMCPLLNVCAN